MFRWLLIITLCAFGVASCMTIYFVDPSLRFTEIPKEVEPIVDRFISDYIYFAKNDLTPYRDLGDAKQNLVIRIRKIDKPGTVGMCITYPGGFKIITLDSEYWYNTLDEDQKEFLVYHELGHCLLGQDHREEMVESEYGNVKLSIMASIMLPINTYKERRGHYKYELFNGKRGIHGNCESLQYDGFQGKQRKKPRKSGS